MYYGHDSKRDSDYQRIKSKVMNNDKSILIIDDEVQIRKLLTITLEMHNYKVIVASNAKEGLAAAAKYAPSTNLVDLGVAVPDGQQVL